MSNRAEIEDPLAPVPTASRPLVRPVVATAISTAAAVAAIALTTYQAVLARRLLHQAGFFSAAQARSVAYVFAAIVVTVALALAFSRTSWLKVLLVAGTTLAGMAVLGVAVLSGQVWPLTVALASLVAAWLVGDVLLRSTWLRHAGLADSPSVALGLGYTCVAVAVYVVGSASWLRWWNAGLAVLLLGAVGVVRAIRGQRLRGAWHDVSRSRSSVGAAIFIAISASFAAIWTAAPDIQYDAVYGKAWQPGVWAAEGRINFALRSPIGNLFGNSYIFPVPAHLVGAHDAGRWMQYLLGLVLAGVIWRVAGPSHRVWGAVGSICLLATPHVIWQMSTGNDDLVLTLLLVAVAVAVLQSDPLTSRPLASSVVIGMLAGGAWSGKLSLAAFAVTIAFAWIVGGGAGSFGQRALGVTAGALVTGAPLSIGRWIATGNPFFPQLNNIFRSPYYPPINDRFNLPYLKDGSLGQLLRLPITAATSPSNLMEAVPPGVVGLLFIPLVLGPLGTLALGRRPRIVAVAVLISVLGWWSQLRYLRYLLPCMIVGLILLGLVVGPSLQRLSRRGRVVVGAVLTIFTISSFAVTLAAFWNIPERLPVNSAIGRESDRDYELRNLPAAEWSRKINEYAKPGDIVVGQAYVRNLIDPLIYSSPDWEFNGRVNWEFKSPARTPDEVLSRWQSFGARFLAIDASRRLQQNYAPDIMTLLESRAQLLWADRGMELYRLVPAETAATEQVSCDPQITAASGCWTGTLNETPGLETGEAVGGVSQTFAVCPDVLYRLSVDTDGSEGQTLISIRTIDVENGTPSYTSATVPAGQSGYIAQTVPASGVTMTVALDASGGAKVVSAVVGTSDHCEP